MLGTENMQIVSRLLAITLERWCSHRAVEKKQSIAAAEGLPQGGGAAEGLPRGGAPSEVLSPLCASATNSLYYIIFYRLKPLKSRRYHSIFIYGPPSRNLCTSA